MAGQEETKWEGKATANLKVKAQQVWQILIEDFSNINKWISAFDTCHRVEGVKGEVGEVRYVGTTVPAAEDGGEARVNWCHEKLVKVDHGERCLSYQVLENNMGIKDYVGSVKVLDGQDELRCQIEWSYVADPIEGMTREGFLAYLTFSVQALGEKMEKELQCA